jgi:hypothetical protein
MIIGVASKRLIRRMAGEVRSTKLARAGKPGTDRAQVHRQSVEAPIAIHTAEWARGQKGQQDRFKNSLSMRWQSGRTSALRATARPIAQPDPYSLSLVAVNRHSEGLAGGGTRREHARVCRRVDEFIPASCRIHVELRFRQDPGLGDGKQETAIRPQP